MDHERAMLLSIRPHFAESILAGAKRAEIRRLCPTAQPGTPVIIYATRPLAAVVGTASTDSVCHGTPSALWRQYRSLVGVTQQEFDQYLDGVSTAYLLILGNVRRLTHPLTLEDMRETAAFQPPRSYRYLDRNSLRTLVNGHPGGAHLLSRLQEPC
jgi:predicted transcriptional regulator